jgi:photosystem II stability/assembly factor-like uncharacterized protein
VISPSRASTRRVTSLLIVAAALFVAACSDSSKPKGPRESVPPPQEGASDSSYAWRPVRLGAGGYVTGVALHPTEANVRYVRTDVGGAYRWDNATGEWSQMLLLDAVPGAAESRGDYSVESVALSASDAEVVYLSVGGDFNVDPGTELPRNGRVLRSSDGGKTWETGTQTFFISGNQAYRTLGERLAVDPQDPDHVLLGTRREGLWSSTDAGATWVQRTDVPVGGIKTPEQDQAGVSFVSFDPDTEGRVYAGVGGVGVFRSDDNGETWRQILEVAAGAAVPAEGKLAGGLLLVSISEAGNNEFSEVERYDPDTDAWTRITPDLKSFQFAIAVDPANPANIVVAPSESSKGKLFRSTDGGDSWSSSDVKDDTTEVPWLATQAEGALYFVGALAIDPLTPNRLWWANGVGLFRSDDVTAKPVRVVLDSRGIEELVTSEVVIPPGGNPTVAAADFQGFHLDDLTLYPQEMLTGDNFVGGMDLDYSGQNPKSLVWIGAEYHIYFTDDWKPRAAVSDDGGISWKPLKGLNDKMFGGEVAISATDPNNIVWMPSYFGDAFGFFNNPVGLFTTTDGGENWTNIADLGGTNDFHRQLWWLGRQAMAADKVDGGVFYVLSSDGRFFISEDGGLTWSERAGAPPCTEAVDCHVIGQLRADPRVAGTLWASIGKGGLYTTADRGTTWRQVAGVEEATAIGFGAPLTNGGPSAVYLVGRVNGSTTAGVWRSGDGGATWEAIDAAPLGLYLDTTTISGDPDVPGRVYVGFSGTGLVVGDDKDL